MELGFLRYGYLWELYIAFTEGLFLHRLARNLAHSGRATRRKGHVQMPGSQL